MSDHPEPVYQDDPDPPPRRRAALVAVAVVCVVVAGVAVGLVTGLPGSADESNDLNVADPAGLPSLSLPAGCDLLTPGQVSVLVPGEPTRVGRGPGVVVDSTESACDWSNAQTRPADPREQPAVLEVKATAAVDEDSARSTIKVSLPCTGSHSTRTTVSGADEACLNHKEPGDRHRSADVSVVSARYKTLVVEVSYERPDWPSWRVDDQSEVTAAALISRVVQRQ